MKILALAQRVAPYGAMAAVTLMTACGGGGEPTSAQSVTRESELTVIDPADPTLGDTVSSTVTVTAKGILAANVGPIMEVRIIKGTTTTIVGRVEVRNTATTADYTFNAPSVAGTDKVDVAYINDALIGTEDRALRIYSATINGITVSSSTTGVTPVNNNTFLNSNGTMRFPASTAVPTWTQCATDGGTCTLAAAPNNIRQVRYGAVNGNFTATKLVKDSIACDSSTFQNDPAPGVAKVCQYSSVNYAEQPGSGVYVDAVAGSDSANPGTFARPWKTLAKVNAMTTPVAGVYLQCGNTWAESLTLGTAQLKTVASPANVVVAGYGNCAQGKALVTGADNVAALNTSQWTQTAANSLIWQHPIPANTGLQLDSGPTPHPYKINGIFINGTPFRVAQWPTFVSVGQEYAISGAKTANPQTDFVGAAPPDTDVAGATVLLRSTSGFIERNTISSYSQGGTAPAHFVLGMSANLPIVDGTGYVLQDKRWMLSAPGQFFHDTTNNILYVYATSQDDLNKFTVEATTRVNAITITGIPQLVLRDIAAVKAQKYGIRLNSTSNALVTNVEAAHNARWTQLQDGAKDAAGLALFDDSQGSVVSNSKFDANGMMGISSRSRAVTISKNVVTNTGMVAFAGFGISGIDSAFGNVVDKNLVNNSAYHGISWNPDGSTAANPNKITNNLVEDSCQRLSDGAGIYGWDIVNYGGANDAGNNSGAQITGNTVVRAPGNIDGLGKDHPGDCVGIYLDTFIKNATVKNNTLIDLPAGIQLHDTEQTTIESNKVWSASRAALWINIQGNVPNRTSSNVFKNNQWVVIPSLKDASPSAPIVNAAYPVQYYDGVSTETISTIISSLSGNMFQGNEAFALTPNMSGVQGGALFEALGTLTTSRKTDGTEAAGPVVLTSEQWHGKTTDLPDNTSRGLYRQYKLTGTVGPNLITNGEFDNDLNNWDWFNTGNTDADPRIVNNLAGCVGKCVHLKLWKYDNFRSSVSMAPNSFYLLKFNAGLLSQGAFRSTLVEKPFPESVAGAVFHSENILASTTDNLLNFTSRNDGVDTSFIESTLDSVSLQKIAFETVPTSSWLGYAYDGPVDYGNASNLPKKRATVTCATFGWPSSCKATDLNGTPVVLTTPYTVPAGTATILLRTDDTTLKLP